MLLEANNSHSQGAKVYKRKKSKAHTRRGAKRYQYNLPKHPRHEQQMRPVWRLVADSNNVDIGAVGYLNASHAMRSSSRKNSVEERVGADSHAGNALMIISLDTRGTVRVGDGGAVPA